MPPPVAPGTEKSANKLQGRGGLTSDRPLKAHTECRRWGMGWSGTALMVDHR